MTRRRRLLERAALAAARLGGVLVVAVLLAGFPLALGLREGQLAFDPIRPLDAVADYVSGLGDGSSLEFQIGYRSRSLSEEGPRVLLTSLAYTVVPGVIAVVLGLLVGSLLGRSRREWAKDVVAGLGFAPDFMVILALQVGVVWLTRTTGHRIAKVATLYADEPAVLLPLIAMLIVPAAYVARLVSVKVQELSGEEFVRLAKSRGLPRWRIHWGHIMPNVLVPIRGNLYKLTAVLLTELFIVEYLFNLPGLTRFVLARGADGGYQFPLVLNGFLGLTAIYFVTLLLLSVLVELVDRGVRRV